MRISLKEGVNTKAFASAEKELKSYAGKHGGIDKKDFMDVAKMLGQISRVNILQAGQVLGQLNRKIQGIDTDPRDKVYSVLKNQGLMESAESLKEKMTEKQMKKREEIVKSMKKDKKGFEDRYGDKADDVMYATATKMAMKTEKLDNEDKPVVDKLIKNLRKGSATHGKQADELEKAVKEEVTEAVIDDLRKIVKRKQAMDIKFAKGGRTKVDMFTASAMVKVHDALKAQNQKKFADAINKDERMFMKMMDFAMKQVG